MILRDILSYTDRHTFIILRIQKHSQTHIQLHLNSIDVLKFHISNFKIAPLTKIVTQDSGDKGIMLEGQFQLISYVCNNLFVKI